MKISKRTHRQIKNMERICTFDMENKVAYVPLHYETPKDLLDEHLSWPGKPVISDAAVEYIQKVIADIPDAFSVEISLTVDSCDDYSYEQLLEALRVTIENTFYYHDEKKRQNNVLSVFFIIIGFLALSIEVIGGFAGWFGEKGTIARSIIETIADVITWVFLWEGCALLLLTYENESTVFSYQMQRFNKVSFRNKDNEILISMDKNQFYEGWIYLSRKEAFARGFILFSNAIFMATLVLQVVECFTSLSSISGKDMVWYVISWILMILLVISNVSLYLDKGKIKKHAMLLSIIVLAFNAASIFLYEIHMLTSTPYFVFNCLFMLALVINIICIAYMRKQSVEI